PAPPPRPPDLDLAQPAAAAPGPAVARERAERRRRRVVPARRREGGLPPLPRPDEPGEGLPPGDRGRACGRAAPPDRGQEARAARGGVLRPLRPPVPRRRGRVPRRGVGGREARP